MKTGFKVSCLTLTSRGHAGLLLVASLLDDHIFTLAATGDLAELANRLVFVSFFLPFDNKVSSSAGRLQSLVQIDQTSELFSAAQMKGVELQTGERGGATAG